MTLVRRFNYSSEADLKNVGGYSNQNYINKVCEYSGDVSKQTVPTERTHGKHRGVEKDKTSFVSCSNHRIFFFSRILSVSRHENHL